MEQMLNITTTDSAQAAYTEVKVENDRIVVTIRQLDGLVLDTFTIADRSAVEFVGVQGRQGETANTTDIRFLASVIGDYKDYAEVGFEVACNGETLVSSCKYVYDSVLADNQTVSAKQYGGDYFICYTAKGLACQWDRR